MSSSDVSVSFGLDNSAFVRGMQSMQDGVGDFKGALSKLGAVLGVAAFGNFLKDAINIGDELQRMSDMTGLSVASLSKFRVAAELSDTSLQSVAGSMKFLSKSLVEAQSASSDTGRIFAALGINAKEALNMDPDAQLELVASRLNTISDEGLRSAASMKLLGKSGTELTPFFKSLDQGKELAEKFGLTLSNDFGKNADEFNDTLTVLKLLFQDVAADIANGLLPSLVSASQQFMATAGSIKNMLSDSVSMDAFLKTVASGFTIVIGVLKTAGQLIGGVAAALVQFLSGDFKGAINTLSANAVDMKETLVGTMHAVYDVWDETGKKAVESTKITTTATVEAVSAQTTSHKELQVVLSKTTAEREKEVDAARKAHDEAMKLVAEAKQINRDYFDFLDEQGKVSLADKKALVEQELAIVEKGSAEELKLKRELYAINQQLYMQIQDEGDKAARSVEKKEKAYQGFFGTLQEGFNKTVGSTEWMNQEMDDSFKDLESTAGSAFHTLTRGFGNAVSDVVLEGGSMKKKLGSIFKSIAADFISNVATMMAKWAVFQAAQSGGLMAAPAAGAASGALSGAGAMLSAITPAGWAAIGIGAFVALGGDKLIKKMWEGVLDVVKDVTKVFEKIFSAIWDLHKKIIGAILDLHKKVIGAVIDAVKQVWEALGNFVGKVLEGIGDALKKQAEMVLDFHKKVFGFFEDIAKQIWDTLTRAFSWIVDGAMSIFEKIGQLLKPITVVFDFIVGLVEKLANVVQKIWDALGKITGGIIGGDGGGGGVIGTIINAGSNIISGATNVVTSIGKKFGFASGGSFTTNGPRMFLAGENGPERITVSPAGTDASRASSGRGSSYVFNGPVYMDEITMRNFAKVQNRVNAIEAQRYANR